MSTEKQLTDLSLYEKHYSDSKFWNKAKSLGKKVLKPAVTLFYVMKSPDVPFKIKVAITGALGYLILPLDMIPDFIPVTGYTDDLAALVAVVTMCESYITPEVKKQVDDYLNK